MPGQEGRTILHSKKLIKNIMIDRAQSPSASQVCVLREGDTCKITG